MTYTTDPPNTQAELVASASSQRTQVPVSDAAWRRLVRSWSATSAKDAPARETIPPGTGYAYDAAEGLGGGEAPGREPPDAAIAFLKRLRPHGPWVISAILPDGPIVTTTARTEQDAAAFVKQHNGWRNLYYSPNPTHTHMTMKAKKTDIAAIEYLYADCDPREGEAPQAAKTRVLEALEASSLPKPTFIVDSGNGLQIGWHLSEAVALPAAQDPAWEGAVATVEARNKALLLALDATTETRNIDRILRLPGTINLPGKVKLKKGRVRCEAKLVAFDDANHPLDAFPAAQDPGAGADTGRGTGTGTGGADKPNGAIPALSSLIVSARIKEIIETGKWDPPEKYASRSEAVMAVAVALVGAGYPDAVVAHYISDPQWPISAHVRDQPNQTRYLAAQIEKARKTAKPVIDARAPLATARQFRQRSNRDGVPILHHHQGSFYVWRGGAYQEVPGDGIRARLYQYLDTCVAFDDKGKPYPFKPNISNVSSVADALRGEAHLSETVKSPAWVGEARPCDPLDIVACSNGLLHLPTGDLLPPTPTFFTHNVVDFAYDPSAPPPMEWQKFLGELWPDDQQSIDTLQEMFGYCLTGDTSQQKAFLLLGVKRSGKGTIARILRAIVGADNTCGPTLASLSKDFGTQPLIGKRLAIIADVRIGPKTDVAAIAERLLSITGEDAIDVARKYNSAWSGKLDTRFVLMSNLLPWLSDVSGALVSRFILFKLSVSFFGREDTGLTNKLLKERTGILNWSIDGLRRLRERGHFEQPDSAKSLIRDLEDLASPIGGFIREECTVGPGKEEATNALFRAYDNWCTLHGHHGTQSNIFGRNLRAVMPEITVVQHDADDKAGQRYYKGIALKVSDTSKLSQEAKAKMVAAALDDDTPF
jgi:P4 family phage/plasmid primase-like protien